MNETSPCVTQMGSSKKRSTAKKQPKLLKKRAQKNKKQLFPQLSFVEDHQETFYIGLNENVHGAYNPVTAKVVDLETAEAAVKNWVYPESQLCNRPGRLNFIKKEAAYESNENVKIKALTFLEDEVETNYNGRDLEADQNTDENQQQKENETDFIDEEFLGDFENIRTPCQDRHKVMVANLIDSVNGTVFYDRDATVLTPRNHNVFVLDTPVEYYGLSMLERKQRGLE